MATRSISSQTHLPQLPPSTTPNRAPRHPAPPSSASSDTMSEDSVDESVHTQSQHTQPHTDPRDALNPHNNRSQGSLTRSQSRSSAPSSNSSVTTASRPPSVLTSMDDRVAAAQSRGLGALTLEVGKATLGARKAVGAAALVGMGISIGLLFAGQPFAVVLLVPAFAAIGVGISWLLRKRVNSGTNPSVEAFKQLMQAPDAATQAMPEFAEAQKLYSFLTESFPQQAARHLHDTFGKLAKLTAPKVAVEAPAEDDASPQQARLTEVDDADGGNDAASINAPGSRGTSIRSQDTGSSHPLTADNLSLLQDELFDTESLSSVTTNEQESPKIQNRESSGYKLMQSPHASTLGLSATVHDTDDEFRADWHKQNPNVDPTKSFDVPDMRSFNRLKSQVEKPGFKDPIYGAYMKPKVAKALGIAADDMYKSMSIDELKVRLERF